MLSNKTTTTLTDFKSLSRDELDGHDDRGNMEDYSSFIIDCSKFSSLPDELIIEIFQYVGQNPFEMMTLSHTCKQWKELINSQFRVWQYVPLTISRSKIVRGTNDEVGHLLLKYFDRFSPVYYKNPKYAKVYKQFDIQYEKYIRDKVTENKIRESEVSALLKAFKKPIIVSTSQFIDFLKHVKKEKVSAERLRKTREYFDSISVQAEKWVLRGYSLLFLVLLVDVCVSLGLLGEALESDTPLDQGLWWLPYSFIPGYIIIIYAYIVLGGLTVNEFFKFKSRSDLSVMPVFFLIICAVSFFFAIFKNDMYARAGLDHFTYNRKNINLVHMIPFFTLSTLSMLIIASENFFQYFEKSNKFPFFTINIPYWATLDRNKLVIFAGLILSDISFIAFSFFNEKLGTLNSFIPMIVGGILGSIHAIKYNVENHRNDLSSRLVSVLPICGSLAVGCLACESFTYWSFIPLTLAVGGIIVYEFIKGDL